MTDKEIALEELNKILIGILRTLIVYMSITVITIIIMVVKYNIEKKDFYTSENIKVSAIHEAGHAVIAEYYFPGSVVGMALRVEPTPGEFWYLKYRDLVLKARKIAHMDMEGENSFPISISEKTKQPSGYTTIDTDKTIKEDYIKQIEIDVAGEVAVRELASTLQERRTSKVGTLADRESKDKYLRDSLFDSNVLTGIDRDITKEDSDSYKRIQYRHTESLADIDAEVAVVEHADEIEALATALINSKDYKLTSEEISNILEGIKEKEEVEKK